MIHLISNKYAIYFRGRFRVHKLDEVFFIARHLANSSNSAQIRRISVYCSQRLI